MIYKHDYQRMALDTDRMMITQCGSDYHDYSNDKLARIYIKWAEEHCPERLQVETDKGRIYVHIDERITEYKKEKWKIWNKMRATDPEYALEELQTAFEHRDIDTIHKYVDLKTLLPPNYKILTNDIFINDKIYTEKEHSIYQTFYALIEPIIIDGTIQSIDKYIQTGNWQRFNYDSMLKGRQLGIDYTELINRSLLFNISFKEIKSIETIDDNSVMATILVADKYTDTNFDLKLK